MKKKKVAIGRKLSLNKATIAALNAAQQAKIAGGFFITRPIECESFVETCVTVHVKTGYCEICE
ncbi:class I lanthipeptide [Chitinophaga qingshengii]|uniref:Class I lanthipeptide n=1 Tax=Chitinophaga qingshengii TaxID=1569794 RepID=A0ABR7TQU9_9BACT|nr:class I lanthipeptide [Chitinophaga qingshengii]MBC9932856.1 class I lanthipeptide [Chitinophaga qingshengii]